MKRKIKLLILFLMIILPYFHGEYSYRKHLGTVEMQCVKVWEEEHCSKGRNCKYPSYGLMLYSNGETSKFSGIYTIGKTYNDTQEWKFFDLTTNKEPGTLATINQLYRLAMNAIITFLAIVLLIMTTVALFVWLAFKSRFKNPISYWLYVFNTPFEAEYADSVCHLFMDKHPFWFYKRDEEQ